jgi:hypothetical protein
VTAPDRVETPITVRDPAERELLITADDNVATAEPPDREVPLTVILFWIVAADTVRSPLIVAEFERLRDEIVVVAFPADKVVPLTIRLLLAVNPDTVVRAPTESSELMYATPATLSA